MRRILALLAAAAVLSTVVGCSPKGRGVPRRDGGADDSGGGPAAPDEDSDGCSDTWEGREEGVDSDGDGTPDYLDDDSDGDGIPDSVECNTVRSGDEPADTDGDGTHDFRDDESDGNGIPDATEGGGDADGDGDPDFRDTDNDGDRVPDTDEIGGDPSAPRDFDGDGTPDHMDIDSDGDGIGDFYESVVDTDRDGTPDRHDDDSDNDGWTDAEESGDGDPSTPPADSDDDGVPDFQDPDSDNDGLGDREEREHGTSRTSADSDGDGVTDLVEVAACAGDPECEGDALDGSSSPRTRGDFVFFEPYMMPPMPERDTLAFATDLRVADVYFLIDTTGSMGGTITNVRTSLSTAGTGIIDRVRAEIADTWFGVGGFDDYPVGGYGSAGSGDRAYYHRQDLTGDAATAQAAVNTLTTHYGADGAESGIAALWAVATGNGLPGSSGWTGDRSAGYGGFAACPAGMSVGWPCFREGAVPIVVLISDIYQHNGPGGEYAYSDGTIGGHAPTYAEAVAAATASRIRVIGVAVSGGGRSQMEQLATDTGAVDGAGAPLVSTASSGAVSDAVVNQIRTLANQTPIDISIVYEDDPSDTVETWAAFVDYIEANETGDLARGCEARPAEDTDGDGHPDTFRDVTPGSPVCFDIVVKQNDTVMPTAMPQLFMATLRVLGDGFTELDSRDIFFLVPPVVEVPEGPM